MSLSESSGVSTLRAGESGVLLRIGLVVVALGACALGMLAMRQARLQAGHEIAQTQLRIQREDERLWKLRAEIAALTNPGRIRELAGRLGPLHALIPKPEIGVTPALADMIPMLEQPAVPGAKPAQGKTGGAAPGPKGAGAVPASKPPTPPTKKSGKPADAIPMLPTGLASAHGALR